MNTISEEPDSFEIAAAVADLRQMLVELRDRLSGATKEHFTIDEVARLTGRSQYTVRKWIRDGQ